MSQKTKLIKKFDLKKIKLDFSRELNLVGDIIRRDHINRLNKGLSVTGKPMERLKPSTIKRKGSDKILIDTGSMSNLEMKEATKDKQQVIVKPHSRKKRNGVTNQQIGYYHQTGQGNLPPREWFGISKNAEAHADMLIEKLIDQELKRA